MDLKLQDGGDLEQAREKSEDLSSANKIDHDKRPSSKSEGDNHAKKKKRSPKTKTSSKSSSRRKDVSDGKGKNGDLLCKSHHSAMKRRVNTNGKKCTIKARRQSMGSINEGIKSDEPSAQDGHRSTSLHGKGSKRSDLSPNNRSNRSLSVHSGSYSTDIDSDLSKNDFSRPSSNRSFNTIESQNDPGKPSSNRSLISVQSKKNRSQPSSTRSLNSLNVSSHSRSIRNDVKTRSFDTADFDSDLEDDSGVKCSVTDIPLVLNDCEKDPEASLVPITRNDKDNSQSQRRSREDKKNIRDPDAKHRNSRQPQLSKSDDLGRASSHSHHKLEGVYYNQNSEPNAQKVGNYDSDEVEEEIEVLTKLSPSSNDTDTSNITPTKGRFRSRRRGSMGNDQLPRTRSRSREQPRSQKDLLRMRSARSPDRLGTRSSQIKSSDKRIKRGTDANVISPESKEAVKKLFGSDTQSSEEGSKNTNQVSLTETEHASSESKPSSTTSTMNAKECSTNSENSSKKMNSPMKDLEKKQRKQRSVGRTMRKDKTTTQSLEVSKKPFGSDTPSPEEDQKSLTGTEKTASESHSSSTTSMKDTEDVLSNLENSSKKINPSSKNLEKKERRRRNSEKIMRTDKASTQSEEEVKKLLGLDTPSFGEEPVPVKSTDQKSHTESEHTAPESQPSSATSMKDAEDSMLNMESATKKTNSPSQDLEKKQRRRRSVEKTMLKDNPYSRIPTKSGHKSPRKSTRERKSRDPSKKNDPDLKLSNSTYDSTLSSEEFGVSEDFVVEGEETDETKKNESEESMKSQRRTEKTIKKDKSSSRRKSATKQKKNRGRDSLQTDSNHQCDLSKESDPGSDEDEEKDNEIVDDDNYLQLTFVAENFAGTDNLFALMDEQLHRSFNQSFSESIPNSTLRSEAKDRGSSIRSFISFSDEIDLKVSTTKYSLSRSAHDAGVVINDFYGDDLHVDDVFRHDDDGFANDVGELTTPKNKRLMAPTSRKKEGLSPPFGLSKSLHSPLPCADSVFSGVREDIKKLKKHSMLKKMRVGITEGGRATIQKAVSTRHLLGKAASTRNMLGQATTKVLARKKEEVRGLLMDDDDSESRL